MGWKEEIQQGLDSWLQLVDKKQNYKEIKQKLIEMKKDLQDELLVIVAGEFKSGKSTFINALLGQPILTSDVTPATAVVTKLNYGEKKRVIGHFLNGETKEYDEKWLELLTAERTGKFKFIREQLSYVEIQLPIALLKHFTIVDSPGLNSDFQHHTEATERFLKRADVAIWLFSYQNAGTSTEVDMLKKLVDYQIDTFGIINRIDMIDEEEDDLEDVYDGLDKRMKNHKINLNKIFGVSSKEALHAKETNNQEELEWSNWEEVDNLFNDLASQSLKKQDRFYQKLTDPLLLFDKELVKEKSALHLHKTLPLMNSFYHDDMPKLMRLKDAIEEADQKVADVQNEWESVLPELAPLTIEDSIQTTEKLLDRIPFNGSHWDSNPHKTWSTLQPLMTEYNGYWVKMEALDKVVQERKSLVKEWESYQTKPTFKKRRIKKLQGFQIRCQDLNEKIKGLKTVSEQIHRLPTQMSRYYGTMQKDIKTFIDNDIKVYANESIEKKQDWNDSLDHFKGAYNDIPLSITDQATKLFAFLDVFQEQVIGSFRTDDFEIRELNGYKNALHRMATIESLAVDYPFEKVHASRNDFMELRKYKSENYQISNFYLKPIHFTDKAIPTVPFELNYNVRSLIGELQFRINNQRFFVMALAVIAVIGFFIYRGWDSEERDPSGGQFATTDAASIESTAVTEAGSAIPEEVEEVTVDRKAVRTFIDGMNRYADSLPDPTAFAYSDWFTSNYTNYAYQDFLYEASDVDLFTVSIRDAVTQGDGSIDVEAVQVYKNDYFLKKYTVHYRLDSSYGEYDVADVSYQLEEEEQLKIPIEDEQIVDFMANFRSSYMTALNQGDFSYIASYLEADSPAYQGLGNYVGDIAGRNFHFEFERNDVIFIEETGVNEYLVTTNEIFHFFDERDEQTRYDKDKEYVLHVNSSGQLVINKINITDTQQEKIIQPTVDLVTGQDISQFFHQFYPDFVDAFNGQGFSYISSYYVPGGKEYTNMETYIPSVVEKRMHLSNNSLEVLDYRQYDETHYLVTIVTQDDFFYQDYTGDMKTVRYDYLLKVEDDGSLLIEESPNLEILEEQEFTWEES